MSCKLWREHRRVHRKRCLCMNSLPTFRQVLTTSANTMPCRSRTALVPSLLHCAGIDRPRKTNSHEIFCNIGLWEENLPSMITYFSEVIGINQETGGATSEGLPSLHLGECSLWSPLTYPIIHGSRSPWTNLKTYLLVTDYIFHYMEVQTLPTPQPMPWQTLQRVLRCQLAYLKHHSQAFMRLTNYYCRFFRDFTTLALPFHCLTETGRLSTTLLLVSNICRAEGTPGICPNPGLPRFALLTTPMCTWQRTSHLSISCSGDKLSSQLIKSHSSR